MNHCRKVILLWIVMVLGLTFSCRKPTQPSEQDTDVVWEKTFGGEGDDMGYSILQSSDGGFIIAGKSYSSVTNSVDIFIVRTDSLGDTLWTKTYDCGGIETGKSIEYASDGGYVITGNSWAVSSGFVLFLLKIDDTGSQMWLQIFDRSGKDQGMCVQQTNDGGYVVVGCTGMNTDHYCLWLLKFNVDGDTLWTKIYQNRAGYSVQQISDGGYIVSGYSGSDVYLMKTDSLGDSLWARTFGTSGYDDGRSVQKTSDGDYIVVGTSYGITGTYDIFAVKTDSLGDTLWTKVYGEPNGVGNSIQESLTGGYVIVGGLDGDVYLFKLDPNGDIIWERTCGGDNGEIGYSFVQTPDGCYVITGFTTSFGAGGFDVYLIKLKPEK